MKDSKDLSKKKLRKNIDKLQKKFDKFKDFDNERKSLYTNLTLAFNELMRNVESDVNVVRKRIEVLKAVS